MSDYHFESNGLFLGFLYYPYDVDGTELFEKVVAPFFEEHRNRLNKYDIEKIEISSLLYNPVAYRMFGTQRLTVLSLIDDYSFCSRHFNKNHIQSLLDERTQKNHSESVDIRKYKFKSIVVTGICETDGETNIKDKVGVTIHKKNGKYPYFGVIRLKIDHRVLLEKGIEAIREIKKEIEALFNTSDGIFADYIVMDCFDNDELTVLAFSNSLEFLIQFMGNIRNIKSKDTGILQYKEGGEVKEKHIFSYTYMNFGYNIDYAIGRPSDSFVPQIETEKDSILLNCLMETRPGHRDAMIGHIETEYSFKIKEKIASGGSVLKMTIKLGEIHDLEKLCCDETIHRDVRKMRVSLQDPIDKNPSATIGKHAKRHETTDINRELIRRIKRKMKTLGVSKIVRDRLLALFEFYDSAKRNLIQTLYFEELSGIGSMFGTIIDDLANNSNIDIKQIEEILDREITNMENACYDRVHNRKYAENQLEYSGGIQQHLTSYGYVYNLINTIFTGKNDEKETYTIITGADRVSSERTHLNLNINHILFPELFVTTAWKEAANRNMKVLGRYHFEDVLAITKPYFNEFEEQESTNRANNGFIIALNTWHDFVNNENSLVHIKNIVLQESRMLMKNDETYNEFNKIMNGELLSYFIKDYVVFHFAFQRDFEKMWFFSFKVLLQTTNVYQRLGSIKRVHVVYMLLRLFMVGFRLDNVNENNKCEEFIKAQMYRPFDNILQEYWLECYKKTLKIAQCLFPTLNDYGFKKVSEYQVSLCERHAELLDKIEVENSVFTECLKNDKTISLNSLVKVNNKCVERRKDIINEFESLFEKNRLIDNEKYNTSDYIICLLSSFVSEVYKIDVKDDNNKYYPIKSVTRNEKGEIAGEWENGSKEYEEICNNMIGIPCDTTGGFFLPHSKVRQRYFALRTVFYKSLWNFRMRNDKNKCVE